MRGVRDKCGAVGVISVMGDEDVLTNVTISIYLFVFI